MTAFLFAVALSALTLVFSSAAGSYLTKDDIDFRESKDPNGRWEIFSPLIRYGSHTRHHHIAPPEILIKDMEQHYSDLDQITDASKLLPVEERAKKAYLDFLATYLLGESFSGSEKSVLPALQAKPKIEEFDPVKRGIGKDWTYLGKTMVGRARLDNVRSLVIDVVQRNVPGAFVETGVWRGGVDIFVRGVFRAYDQAYRPVVVCDSFHGLPPGHASIHKSDIGWDKTSYLEISAPTVAKNFMLSGLLDDGVIFVKGFFNDTMPHIAKQVKRIAVLRMDGDMYQSTVDVLYHLYSKVPVGGWVILDDWFGFPAKDAVEDFMKVHNCVETIQHMDKTGAYWQKTKDPEVQFWRYQQQKFN